VLCAGSRAAMFSVFATTSATISTPMQVRAHRLK
jgi:hypothetical protein